MTHDRNRTHHRKTPFRRLLAPTPLLLLNLSRRLVAGLCQAGGASQAPLRGASLPPLALLCALTCQPLPLAHASPIGELTGDLRLTSVGPHFEDAQGLSALVA